MLPLKLINTAPGPNEVKFRLRQYALAKFGRGPALPSSLDSLRAMALVETALAKNEEVTDLWLDIVNAWERPGCQAYTTWALGNRNLKQYMDQALSNGRLDGRLISRAYEEWQTTFKNDPNVAYMNSLIDNFILKAFNGPIKPALINRWVHKARPVPKYKERVIPDKAWRLKHAVAFMSWCHHKGIDFRELDQLRLGADYEVVTSGKKPTTAYGRKRKPEINRLVKRAGLRFISDKAICSGAEKWYGARVIRGSIVDAASDFGVNNPSTFARLIKDYDRIAGLR